MILTLTALCGHCGEEAKKVRTIWWTNKTVCEKCAEPFGFLRKKKELKTKKAIEPDCEHEFVPVGLVFCTDPELAPHVCARCGWHKMVELN